MLWYNVIINLCARLFFATILFSLLCRTSVIRNTINTLAKNNLSKYIGINVSHKNITTLDAEIYKDFNIQLNREQMHNRITELYNVELADQYIKDLKDQIIYKHDESSFAGAIAPYCCSITMYPFLNNGIKGIGGLSTKPNNLDSFCGIYCKISF